MCADKRIGGRRFFRMVAVFLLALGGPPAVYFSLHRLAKHNIDRVKNSNTLIRVLGWYNAARLKHAGSERSITAILTHVGRRSGNTYQTPLGAAAYGDGFVLAIFFGADTDWCRNVMAAGTCTLTWKGQTYQLERPGSSPDQTFCTHGPCGSGSRCAQRASRTSYGCIDETNRPKAPSRTSHRHTIARTMNWSPTPS
jgi:hypothetical protein